MSGFLGGGSAIYSGGGFFPLGPTPAAGGAWTLATGAAGSYFAVGYGNGVWVAGGPASGAGPPANLSKSTDGGHTWTTFTIDPAVLLAVYAVRYLNGAWYVVGTDNSTPTQLLIYRSTDNTASWTQVFADVGSASSSFPTDIQWNGAVYLVLDSNSNRFTSATGAAASWTKNAGGGSITTESGLFALDGANFMTCWDVTGTNSQVAESPNGQPPWTDVATALQLKLNTTATPLSSFCAGIVGNGAGTFMIAAGNDAPGNSIIERVTNTAAWTSTLQDVGFGPVNDTILGLAYGPLQAGGNLWMVGSAGGLLASSPDLLTWTQEHTGMTEVIAIAPGLDASAHKIFVAVGNAQIAYRAT